MGSPLVDLASQIPQGTPQSVDTAAQYIGQNGLAPAYTPGSDVNPAQEGPNTPSSPTKTGLRAIIAGMMTRFSYGAGQAMKKDAGLPTDDELATSAAQRAHLNAQTQLTQSQAEKIPVDIGNGQLVYLPPAAAAQIVKQRLANTGKTDAATITSGSKYLKEGYRLNAQNQPEPIPDNELSPVQKQQMATQKAIGDYNDAKAALAAAGNDPNSPLFKQKQQDLQAKQAILQQTLGLREQGLGLQQQGLDLKKQEFDQKMGELTPAAQSVMMQTSPARQQIQDLKSKFEGMKDDNTPAKFLPERAKYAAGIQSDIGSAGDAIAQLELNRVAAGARILKGSSRAIQALEMAMKHTPNVWIDSPKMIYGKLDMLDKALGQIEDSAQQYGRKGNSSAAPTPAATHRWNPATQKIEAISGR